MSNAIGSAVQAYQDVTLNPTVSAGLQGTAAFGVGTVGWDRIIETLRSLLRRPASFALRMSPQEFDQEMEDIKHDKKLKWILPGALGLGTAGLSLATSYRPNEEYGGLFSWNAKGKPLDTTRYREYTLRRLSTTRLAVTQSSMMQQRERGRRQRSQPFRQLGKTMKERF